MDWLCSPATAGKMSLPGSGHEDTLMAFEEIRAARTRSMDPALKARSRPARNRKTQGVALGWYE
jgi:hypothetical protein